MIRSLIMLKIASVLLFVTFNIQGKIFAALPQVNSEKNNKVDSLLIQNKLNSQKIQSSNIVKNPSELGRIVTPITKLKNTQSKYYYLCRFNNEVRSLRLNQNNEGTCYIDYTKAGIDERVGESKSIDICSSVIKNIKSNLENASWKCKNISSTYITLPK